MLGVRTVRIVPVWGVRYKILWYLIFIVQSEKGNSFKWFIYKMANKVRADCEPQCEGYHSLVLLLLIWFWVID